MNVIGQHCPHCGQFATVRTSETVSEIMRVLYFQCRDFTCGHTWVAQMEAVRTITPPSIPNPRVNLPISTRAEVIKRRVANHSARDADPRQLRLDNE